MKPKLLFIINTLTYGGAERVVSLLLNHLAEKYELHLVIFENIIKYPIPASVQVYCLQESSQAQGIHALLRLPVMAKKLASYCKSHQIDSCISFLNRACYINAIRKTCWPSAVKTIMCERSHQSSILQYLGGGSKIFAIISKKLISWSYQKADLILTNSELSRLDLQQNFKITRPIHVVYNPVHITDILQKAAEPVQDYTYSGFTFISVGKFRVEKNLQLLLQAFSLLKDLPIQLIIIGGGPLETNLKQQAGELGIADKVWFGGFKSNPFKYIKNANCFVLSSHTEGFPNVLLEALACGKSVISTDCKSGPREILAAATDMDTVLEKNIEIAEYGILVPENNPPLLAFAMQKIFQENNLREQYEEKSIRRAAEFSNEIIIPQFEPYFY